MPGSCAGGRCDRTYPRRHESGGRRIKRAIYLDQTSVRFLTPEERTRLRRFALIDSYLDRKQAELEAFNDKLIAEGKDPVNTRRVTNVGTFRSLTFMTRPVWSM